VLPKRKMAHSQEYFPIKQNKYHLWLEITLNNSAGLLKAKMEIKKRSGQQQQKEQKKKQKETDLN